MLGIEIACTFQHHAAEQPRGTFLSRRIDCRAATEGEFDGHGWNGVILDQPRLDAAGADHAVDLHRRRRQRHEDNDQQQKPDKHGHAFSSTVWGAGCR